MNNKSVQSSSSVSRDERELLVAHVLGKTKEWVIAHPEAPLDAKTMRRLRALLARRASGEPFAYIVGEKWFYGRPFKVTKATLIPRPETETLVEAVLATELPLPPLMKRGLKKASSLQEEVGGVCILDVGTGSGAVAITLAAELPNALVTAIDISTAALRVARANARRHGVQSRLQFIRENILKSHHSLKTYGRTFLGTPLVIVANLPYIRTGDWKKLERGITGYEPKLALTSGTDGLDHYRALMRRVAEMRFAPEFLFLEADPWQMKTLKELVSRTLPNSHIETKKDLHGDQRVLIAKTQ